MKLRSLLLATLFGLSMSVGVAAPVSAQTKANIVAQVKAAGSNAAKVTAAMQAVIASLPASQRAAAAKEAMTALLETLPGLSDAAQSELVNAAATALVGTTKQQAANAGAGNAGQTAAATAVANAILSVTPAKFFASVRTSVVAAGAFEASLPQAPDVGSGSGDTVVGNKSPTNQVDPENVSAGGGTTGL